MKIAKDTVATLEYRLTLDDGEEVDASTPEDPLVYLHGYEEIVPGLERALEGKTAGERIQVTVKPEDAYGPYDPNGAEEVPRDQLPADLELEVGGIITATDDDGDEVEFMIKEVRDGSVVVDFNHPMAGKTLHFDVTIREVRAATEEEKEHGHAHGPGHDH
ncbi:MAG TPA: peptidylprolyl isomerase [Gemmatimonadaceae bacterium]|nr:peptidylprolyl isomerase [Gemmatimonadaceae bacterium]